MNEYDKMPPIEVRKESLRNYAHTFVDTSDLTEEELDSVLQSVVEETREYSARGYWIFGIKEEQELLCDLMKKII